MIMYYSYNSKKELTKEKGLICSLITTNVHVVRTNVKIPFRLMVLKCLLLSSDLEYSKKNGKFVINVNIDEQDLSNMKVFQNLFKSNEITLSDFNKNPNEPINIVQLKWIDKKMKDCLYLWINKEQVPVTIKNKPIW